MSTLYSPAEFRQTLLEKIAAAQSRICIVALYLENDDGGRAIMNALYAAKQARPHLDISILVDWHRAQRGRIGAARGLTNADWYCEMATQHADIAIPVYGIPVNTREALGVLHLKGFIIDDTLLYSGASLNDVYLHQHDKYRYDRYQIIRNPVLADTMFEWMNINLKQAEAVNRLDFAERPSSPEIKNETRQFRQDLRGFNYQFEGNGHNEELTVTPLVGLGKRSLLNKTIFHLMPCAEQKLVICTPYFNMPAILVRNIIHLLRQGKKVEIIVGDKTANDFYIPEDQPFKIIGANLNPRAWRLDLENAVLIHDPLQQLTEQREKELTLIRQHTTVVKHYRELESIADYPAKVRKLIRRLRRIRIDRLISRIL